MDDTRPKNTNLTNETHLAHAPRLRRMRQLSQLLDGAIVIPGTNQRIGLDPILGLIPGGGDTLSAALSGYIIIEAARMGLPRSALTRMVMNLVLDTVAGSVPVLGDIFDVFSKANLRNMQIVESHAQQASMPSAKADKLFIGLLIVGLLGFALAVGFITVAIWSFVSNSLN
jgi:Domain of unknown function (DUF4112)